MADIVQFSTDVFGAFKSLGLGWKILIGGAASYIGLKSVVLPVTVFIIRLTKPLRERKTSYDPAKIYLHIFPRTISRNVANLSPYAIKVESWLRLQKIPHEIVESVKFSKATGQIPYVIYNDEELTDSTAIINYFTKERGIDATEGLTDEQQASAQAIAVMVDESFAWSYIMHRYVYQFALYKKTFFNLTAPQPIKYMIERNFPKHILQRAQANTVGRKTEAAVNQMGFDNLNALSLYLGEKQFMMGDQITKVDCAVFGHLSQVIYLDFPYPQIPFIKVYCANLLPYMERIKTQLWPDWDDIVVHYDRATNTVLDKKKKSE